MKRNIWKIIPIMLLGGILTVPAVYGTFKSANELFAADKVTGSVNLGSDAVSGWECNQAKYCSAYYGGKAAATITAKSISDFSCFSSGTYTLKVWVTGFTNSGTNSVTVSTITSTGSVVTVGTAITGKLGSGSNLSSATKKEVGPFEFTSSSTVSGFQIELGSKCAITKVRWEISPKEGTDPVVPPTPVGSTYELVSDASTLYVGDTIVLGSSTNNKVAGAFETKYLKAETASFSSGAITSNSANEITLGGTSGAFTLITDAGQIVAGNNGSISLGSTGTTWSISISSNAAVISNGSGSIQYNTGSPRFTYYTSEQGSIEIYKKEGGEVQTFTVAYDGNGAASGEMADSNSPYNKGSIVTVKENAFTPITGRIFKEWNTKADGTGTSYAEGQTFTISANTTLYAIWEEEYIPVGDSFTKVTSTSALNNGNTFLFVYNAGSIIKANGSLEGSDHFAAYDAKIVNDELTYNNDKITPLTLVKEGGDYYIELNGSYLSLTANDTNKLAWKTKDKANKWSISFNNGNAVVSSTVENVSHSIFYNASGTGRFSNYSSTTMASIEMWAKSGHAKEVSLSVDSLDLNVGNTGTVKVSECIGFEPSNYTWEITSGSEFAKISAGQGTNEVTIEALSEGDAELYVTVDGVKAKAVIHVHDYKYDVLSGDAYFITSNGGMMSASIENIPEVNFNDVDNEWQFEKNYLGNNAYYIKNGSNYLNFEEDVNPDGKNISKMCVSSTPVNSWTVEASGDAYKIYTETESHGTRYIAQKSDDLKWYAFTDVNTVSLFSAGDLVYDSFEVVKGCGITYPYVGDDFVDNNVKINAVFTNGYKKDITKDIVWGKINADGTVNGVYKFGGDDKVITLTNINVYAPIEDSLTATGIKAKYSVGESVSVESVKLTYARASGTIKERILTADQYTVSPTQIDSEEIDKITVTFNNITSIKKDYAIEVKPVDYVPATKLGPGDEIVLTANYGNHQYEGQLETDGTNYNRLLGTQFEYAPKGESVFTLESAGSPNKFYLKDKASGKYLNGQVDGVITSDKVETMESLDGKFKTGEFQFKPSDSNEIITVTNENTYGALFTYNEGTESWNGIVYTDSTYMDYYELEMVVIDDTALLSVTHYNYTAETEVKCDDIEYKVFNYNPLYLVNPYSTGSKKDAFTFTYNENLEQAIHWWTISCGNEYVGCTNSGSGIKFTLEDSESFDIDVYRNKNIEPSVKVTSLKASVTDSSLLFVKKGETFNWNNVTVNATYEDGTHSMIDYGAYTVSEFDTNILGDKVVTISYQGKTTTITIHVESANSFTPFIKQEYNQIYVGDENINLTTTQEAPEGEPVSWSSSNPSVATIDQNGHITPLSTGKVSFTVTSFDGYKSDTLENVNVYQRVSGIELETTEKTINIGESFELIANVLPADAHNKRVIFTSLNPEICSVEIKGGGDADRLTYGVVTGLKEGDAVIQAETENQGLIATCTVHVSDEGSIVPVTGVSFSTDYMEVDLKADDFKLNPIIAPSNATVQGCTFESSDTSVVTVSNSGWVDPKGKGTATITVTTLDGGFTAKITIKVKENVEPKPVESVSLNNTTLNLDLDGTYTAKLTATIEPADAYDRTLTWSSSDEEVAIVDDHGNVEAVGVGTCTITVKTSNNKTATCVVTVISSDTPVVHVNSVSLNETGKALDVGDSFTLVATINPTNADNKAVTWSSSDESIATVNQNGKVTAVAPGTVEITVTTVDGDKTASCTVIVKDEPTPTPISATGVELNKETLTLEIDEEATLVATVSPSNADNKDVAWSSSNESVVTVDENGKVTAVGSGTATVTVTTEDGEFTATCSITVKTAEVDPTPDPEPSDFSAEGIAVVAGVAAVPAVGIGLGVGIPVSVHKKHKKLRK